MAGLGGSMQLAGQGRDSLGLRLQLSNKGKANVSMKVRVFVGLSVCLLGVWDGQVLARLTIWMCALLSLCGASCRVA